MKVYRYDVRNYKLYTDDASESPFDTPEELEKSLSEAGFRNIRTYSNIPECLIKGTLLDTAKELKPQMIFLVPLQCIPRLLEAVVEKSLNPYALFVQD
jgi:hypothetical protein